MSQIKIRKEMCDQISANSPNLFSFTLNGYAYLSKRPSFITPFCTMYTRKLGAEFRIDYDCCLSIINSANPVLDDIKSVISLNQYIYQHNVYDPSFTLFTITEGRKIKPQLKERIIKFLFDNTVGRDGAKDFLTSGRSEFLRNLYSDDKAKFEERVMKELGG